MKKDINWKSNGRIQGRTDQIELIRSDKYGYQGVHSVIIKGKECDQIAPIVLNALNASIKSVEEQVKEYYA